MRKLLMPLAFVMVMMLAFTACGTNANEPITVEQTTTTTHDSQDNVQTTPQEPQNTPSDSATGAQTGQADTSDRIRQFHSTLVDIADTMDRWADELDMTIDEIFDYVLAHGSNEILIQNDADVSALVSTISFDSLDSGINTRDFINTVSQAYTVTRLLDIVNGWANELSMTVDEMIEYFSEEAVGTSRLADELGVEFDNFQFALIQVDTAFLSIAGHIERR